VYAVCDISTHVWKADAKAPVALDSRREYTEQREYDEVIAALRQSLGADRVTALLEEGRAWRDEQAVVEAMQI
jgi:hypothetical protein